MKHILNLILFAIVGALTSTAHAQLLLEQQTGPLDRIVAVVEGDVILQSELERAIETVQRQFSGNPEQLPPRDVLQRQVLDRLILQHLQVQRASDSGIRIDEDDINEAVAGIAANNGINIEQLRGALARQGVSYASFRQQVGDQIMVQKNRQSVLQESVQVSDSEIDNVLASPSFDLGEIHLQHILIGIPAGANAEDIAAVAAEAAEVATILAEGGDFTAAAIRYSDAPDALEGGDLGWRKLNEVPKAYADLASSMQAGEISDPVRGPSGFHIIKLVAKRDPPRTVVTEYHARHIMLAPDVLTSVAETEQEAKGLRQRIVDGGEDFADLAREYSDDDTTANTGGDMGWFPAQAWGAAVAQQVQQLDDGEVSMPFRTEGGWHILQLLGMREQDRTEEVRRERVRQSIENRKSEEFFSNYLREMRAMSFVDIRLDSKQGEPASNP